MPYSLDYFNSLARLRFFRPSRKCPFVGDSGYLDIGRGHVIWQANAIDPLHPNDLFHFSIREIEIDLELGGDAPELRGFLDDSVECD
ncbi:hypothetical protein H6F89_25485 [Cyanobacteria bacterium FACHB-63]|nr:hypothetical protein [Cyanobacteria bacterium FACHB-63]